jgi:hypothetical protein
MLGLKKDDVVISHIVLFVLAFPSATARRANRFNHDARNVSSKTAPPSMPEIFAKSALSLSETYPAGALL